MVNPLFFRASPRGNIEEVERHNSENEKICDVLYVRYAFEFDAYKFARDYFLEHEEYDYFIIATDDIVVKPEHLIQLLKDLDDDEKPVLSGMMNVDQHEYNLENGNLNICQCLALKDRKLRQYDWMKRRDLPSDNIFQMKFSGFPLMAIRRDVVSLTPFAADGVFKGKDMKFGASLDFVFCWFCHEMGIPIFVDKRIDMQHLRTSGIHQAGERKKEVWLNDRMIQFGLNPINSLLES
ncbi:glycosyltransferase [Nitrososphaeria virus YSH_922147]|uniref:Glycosyltransferase n=1 Tax=Nitrososphaeria virus YSH_922147 TaxID=3071323 RepID=A0A976YF17_9CAUD|nr:glycosyltransferase [Yangshan Harbor Nitrososphaeria virus]UVF62440.1 glycosyltransferase [Nitrososphaeria virus YSH_922147]